MQVLVLPAHRGGGGGGAVASRTACRRARAGRRAPPWACRGVASRPRGGQGAGAKFVCRGSAPGLPAGVSDDSSEAADDPEATESTARPPASTLDARRRARLSPPAVAAAPPQLAPRKGHVRHITGHKTNKTNWGVAEGVGRQCRLSVLGFVWGGGGGLGCMAQRQAASAHAWCVAGACRRALTRPARCRARPCSTRSGRPSGS